jgi:hypothetical protein
VKMESTWNSYILHKAIFMGTKDRYGMLKKCSGS